MKIAEASASCTGGNALGDIVQLSFLFRFLVGNRSETKYQSFLHVELENMGSFWILVVRL